MARTPWPDNAGLMILAIDPGAFGAFAWVNISGELIEIKDTPTIKVNGKSRLSSSSVRDLMTSHSVSLVIIEQAQAMPRKTDTGVVKMGAGSTGAFHYGAGILEGVAVGLGLSVEIIHPRTWKTRAGVPADKGAVRQMAQRFWPDHAHLFGRKKDDGRGDAALLGRWAALKMRGVK